jgi:hypothetical protein
MGPIRKWYEGKSKPYENDPDSPVVFIAWDYERHWTSRVAHVVIDFYLREWKWVWGTGIAVIGLLVALRKMG